jgi:hypothetical protein
MTSNNNLERSATRRWPHRGRPLNRIVRTHEMAAWLIIIFISAGVGLICAWRLSGRVGLACAGVVPLLGVLTWVLYLADQPSPGGGASMWPIAFVFAGAVAGCIGIGTYVGARKLFGAL